MSVRLLLALWKTKLPITPSQKLVLHCLAYFTNDDKGGLCYPSYHTIAEITGLTRRGVIKIIEQLCSMGFLIKKEHKNTNKRNNLLANHYKINLVGSEPSSPGVVNPVHQGSEPSSPNLINDLIIDLKENIKRKNESSTSAPQDHLSSVLRSTAKLVVDFLKLKTGRNYQHVDATLKPIIKLLKEGITLQQCKQVIARKTRDWKNNKDMEKYLRPSTLFNRNNFYNKYLPELVTEQEKKINMKLLDE